LTRCNVSRYVYTASLIVSPSFLTILQELTDSEVALKHRVKPTSVSLADRECAIIVEYTQEDFVALPDGKYGELKATTSRSKKVKVRSDLLANGVEGLLQELISKSKWMKVISEDVKAKLTELKQREADRAGRKAESYMAENSEVPGDPAKSWHAGNLSKGGEDGRHRRREGGKKHHRSRVEKISSAALLDICMCF
jgi:hypothetical protein